MEKIKIIDLFCGLGGFHVGMHKAFKNMECVLASDIDSHARLIYEKNFKGVTMDSDVTQLDEKEVPEHHILCAGFPCQPFSTAGHLKGFDDARGTLFYDILRIAKHHKTPVLFLENVANFIKHDKGNTYKTIKRLLEEEGYFVSVKVLNAKDYGLAQNRQRTIIIASRKKEFDFEKVKGKKNIKKIKDILEEKEREYLKREDYTIIPDNLWKTQRSGLIFCGYRNKTIRKTGVRENTEHLSRVHKQPNRIYHINGTHPTLSASEVSGRYFVYDGNNVFNLSVRECFRLQGFPESYKRVGINSQLYKRIGNSVPVDMIAAVAKEIKKQLF